MWDYQRGDGTGFLWCLVGVLFVSPALFILGAKIAEWIGLL